MKTLLASLVLSVSCLGSAWADSDADVRSEDVPEKGLQPEVATDAGGTVHLVYLQGDPKAADVRYTTRKPGEPWQPSRTVNSIRGSAIAVGSIRGAQLALGKGGVVHVVWNGNGAPRPALWYARLSAGAGEFEPQRDLLGATTALDGGASVAADRSGGVTVAWHGNEGPGQPEESQRLVFVLGSKDDGETFAPLEAGNRSAPGVCACCSLRAFSDPEGRTRIFFRSAANPDRRSMTLLSSEDGAWDVREIEPWNVAACPMSSAAVAAHAGRLLGAWETGGQVRLGWIGGASAKPITVAAKDARHPALAIARDASVLVAWSEGTGWNQGGKAVWQVLDPQLKPKGSPVESGEVPAWGKVAAYAELDGGFVVLR